MTAVFSAICRARPQERAALVKEMYDARIDPAEFREALEVALEQSQNYLDVIEAAGGFDGLMCWCWYADFPIDHLPACFPIYRGGSCSPEDLECGLSWTLKFDCAAWFAMRYTTDKRPPVVLATTIERDWALAYLGGRGEFEVIPSEVDAIEVVTDLAAIQAAASRWRA